MKAEEVIGERIRLREIRPREIAEGYCRWLNDPGINRYLESRYRSWDEEELKEYVARIAADGSNVLFAIATREDDRHIGNIKLGPVDWNHRRGSVGILIGDSACHGKGYGSEAIALMAEYSFRRLDLNKITAAAYAVNLASLKIFDKAGFTREGVRRGHVFCDGVFVDSIEFGLLRGEWEARRHD